MDAKLLLKLTDNDGNPFFGPGVAELLSLIDETGSVRHASEEMGLSYSKAWKMIRGVEKATGKEAVSRRQGGKGGGKSVLTDDAVELVEKYRELRLHTEKEANRKAKELFG